MLENFIYAKLKSLFEEALNNGEVLNEAIVFIEDTKEIWNHGTYFGDIYKLNTPIEDLGTISQQLYDDLIDAINKEKLIIATMPGLGSLPCVSISLEGMIVLLINMHPLYSIILINEDRTYTVNNLELPEFINYGDGNKFLADDGYYKEIESNIQAVDTSDVVEDVNVKYATTAYVDGLIGDINTILESIINGGSTVTKIITFLIGITEYQAEEGMTWEEWVNSSYNVTDLVINNNYVLLDENVVMVGHNLVLKNHIITANETYVISGSEHSGGSPN